MRKFTPVLACLVFIVVSIPIRALSQDTKSKYDVMLHGLIEKVENKDPSLADAKVVSKAFKALRFAYTETPQYDPYGLIKTETRGAMLAAVTQKEYKKALEYAEKILKEDYVDMDAHTVAYIAYMATGKQDKAKYHEAIANILFLSMVDGGNGDRLETAIEVISVQEEYSFLNHAALEKKSQRIMQADGHHYDKMTVVDPASGKTFEIYFCLDKPFNWIQNLLKKPVGDNTEGRLSQAIRAARSSNDIPMEWAPSWPVPTGGMQGYEFKVFFYPGSGREADPRIYAPQAEVTLNTNTGTAIGGRWSQDSQKAVSSKRWPDEISEISMDEFLQLREQLYRATEEVALIYARLSEITPDERVKVQEYGKLFSKMVEPALRPYYYKLNPDFWAWLRDCGALSINR